MTTILRYLRKLTGLMLMVTIATFPACGSMGGGMKYLIVPPQDSTSASGA